MPAEGGLTFGVFELDSRTMVLYRKGRAVSLPTKACRLLYELVSRPGQIVSKKQLLEAVWPNEFVSDGSVHQRMSQVRAALDVENARRYLSTRGRVGYRFFDPDAPPPIPDCDSDLDIDAELDELAGAVDGKVALETLNLEQIVSACGTYERLLPRHKDEAPVHLALANAYALRYEGTRTDVTPKIELLTSGLTHAREAVRLAPKSAEAWAILGFILDRLGVRKKALAALRKGARLALDKIWMPHVRLSYVASGQERLDAAYAAIEALPTPMAYSLASTVFVGRSVLDQAEHEVDAAWALMTDQPPDRFHVVAVCWMKGLLCMARGDDDQALIWLHRELALEARGQVYARECCANVWCAIGVIHLRRGNKAAAGAAFREAIARIPRHPLAHVGLLLLMPKKRRPALPFPPTVSLEAAIAHAALLSDDGDAAGAAKLVAAALAKEPDGSTAGWLIPIEPLLDVQGAPEAWAEVLATLKTRWG